MKLELILLGLLKKGPRHGYELKKLIEEEIRPLTNITLTSIYYTLEKLQKVGYLGYDTQREGGRPERCVYHLTKKGERRLQGLLIRNFLFLERPFFNLDLVLYFLDQFPYKRRINQLIARRIKHLKEVIDWIEKAEDKVGKHKPLHKSIIFEHLKCHLEVELKFTHDLKELMGFKD